MGNRARATQSTDFRRSLLYKVSAAAALMAGGLLLVGTLSLLTSVLLPGRTYGWLTQVQNTWLLEIFKLHAGFSGVQIGLLHSLVFLDIVILALVGTICLGLCAALWRISRVWSIVAAVQPFLGIVLFVATQSAGRSSVMGAALVISLVMLRSTIFNKATGYLGVAASMLLLLGDFSAGIPPSTLVAALFGIAYLLIIIWFFLIARRLFQLGQGVS